MEKVQLFDQNHGLSPLKKCQFCVHFKSMFILSRKACLLTRTSPNTFSRSILHKKNVKKISNFWPKPWTKPLEKCQFCGFLKPMFSLSSKACLLNKRSKIVSRFIFPIYYMGIQGVTRGYIGLQRVTRGYRWLQGVTEGYKWLQGVTKNYRNFFF